MNVNKIILGIISIMICAVMVGCVFVPSVANAIDDTKVVYNNSSLNYAVLKNDGNVTISFDETGYNVNGENVHTTTYARLVVSDSLIIGRSGETSFIDYYDGESFYTHGQLVDLTVTISSNTIELAYTYGEDTVTDSFEYDWLYYVANEGDYRVLQVDNSNQPTFYMNSINDVVALGWNSTSIYSLEHGNVKINGDTRGSYTVNSQLVSGTTNVYTCKVTNTTSSDIIFNIDDQSYGVNAIVVPYKIVGDKTGFESYRAMLNVLPIIAIAGLIMVGIYIFINRK